MRTRRADPTRFASPTILDATTTKDNIEKKPMMKQIDKDLDQAIHRVYQRYGPDLSVFFRAVRKQVNRERAEAAEKRGHVLSLKRR